MTNTNVALRLAAAFLALALAIEAAEAQVMIAPPAMRVEPGPPRSPGPPGAWVRQPGYWQWTGGAVV